MAVELIAFHLKRIKTGKKSHDSKRWKSVNTSKPGAHMVRRWEGRKQPCLHPCLRCPGTLYTSLHFVFMAGILSSPSYHPRAPRPASKISMSSQPQLTAQTDRIFPGLAISSHPFPTILDRKWSKEKPRCRFVQAVCRPGQGSYAPALCDL